MAINSGDRVRITNPAFHGAHGWVQDVQGHADPTNARIDVVVILDSGPIVKIGLDDVEPEPARQPREPITEHGVQMAGGGMQVRPDDPEAEEAYPLERWIPNQQRFGGKVYARKIIVVEDWHEVPKR